MVSNCGVSFTLYANSYGTLSFPDNDRNIRILQDVESYITDQKSYTLYLFSITLKIIN